MIFNHTAEDAAIESVIDSTVWIDPIGPGSGLQPSVWKTFNKRSNMVFSLERDYYIAVLQFSRGRTKTRASICNLL